MSDLSKDVPVKKEYVVIKRTRAERKERRRAGVEKRTAQRRIDLGVQTA